jgi:hypothetical protein
MHCAILEGSLDKDLTSHIRKELRSFAGVRFGLSVLSRELHLCMVGEPLNVHKLLRYKDPFSLGLPVARQHACRLALSS